MSVHNQASLCDRLPVWHFDENLMVFKDGSLGAGLEITGKDIATATNANISLFTRELENLLKTVTEGFKIQVFHNISKDVERNIKEHEKLSRNHDGVYGEVAKARVRFLRKNAKQGNYYHPKIYIFIRGNKYKFKNSNLFTNSKEFEQVEKEKYLEHREDFLRTFDTVKSYLDSNCLYALKVYH